jgi:hypothetical protein
VSERDTFLARWLRLKQEAGKAEAPAVPFDLANLPPIESLTSEDDMSVFLQSGVPADMVRAALRSAWRVDPAIRDFVGIAESQWDFNDPAAMPGFGPLDPMDEAQGVVTRSATPVPTPAEAFPETPQNRNPQRDGQLDKVWLSGEPSREEVWLSGAPLHEEVWLSGVPLHEEVWLSGEPSREDAWLSGEPSREDASLSGEPSREGVAHVGPGRETRSNSIPTDTRAPGASGRHGGALPKPS